MKFYLINVEKIKKGNGCTYKYPDVGHKNYKNKGYSLDKNTCIWATDDNIEIPDINNIINITEEEANDYLSTWEREREEYYDSLEEDVTEEEEIIEE